MEDGNELKSWSYVTTDLPSSFYLKINLEIKTISLGLGVEQT